MKRRQRTYVLSGVLLVGVVWLAALVLLFSQQGSVLDSRQIPTLVVMPSSTLVPNQPATPLPDPTLRAPAANPIPVLQPVSAPNTVVKQPIKADDLAPIEPVSEPVANQIVLRFNPKTSAEEQAAYIESIGGEVQQRISALNTVVVHVSSDKVTLPKSTILAANEPDYFVTALVSPVDDTYFPDQWALPVIGAPDAWSELPANAPSITVAVLDSGICADHADLAGRITTGWDFVQDDAVPQDEYGHGCAVSGVIAANSNNLVGMAGVAPNVNVMPLRVLDAQGIGTYSRVAAALVYAVDHDAKIINLSLGGTNPSATLEAAVQYAVDHGVMVIAAAGNTQSETVLYPAAYAPVIAVGAVDRDLQTASFSSRGAGIDLYAPGKDILSTSLSGYALFSGTSLAAPHVAGVAALEMGLGRTLTVNGGIVHVAGQTAVPTPTVAPQPTATTAASCDLNAANEAQTAFMNAIEQGVTDLTSLREAYLAAAAECFKSYSEGPLSIDSNGLHISGDSSGQFKSFGTKWLDDPVTTTAGAAQRGQSFPISQPPGTPGIVTYSFMPQGVSMAGEETLTGKGGISVSLESLKTTNSNCAVDETFEKKIVAAFDLWSSVSNIKFVPIKEVPDKNENYTPFNQQPTNGQIIGDIRIGGNRIDGFANPTLKTGLELAHAYFPPMTDEVASGTGDLFFDADENWGCNAGVDAAGRQVLDIGLVAAHEIGHTIGMDHETIAGVVAIMNPFYNTSLTGAAGPKLQSDDINGSKAIYGLIGFGSPTVIAPALNSIVNSNTPVFQWGSVPEATQYQIQIDDVPDGSATSDFSEAFISDTVAAPVNRFTPEKPLLNGNYIWRVRAFKQASDAANSGWSDWSPATPFAIQIGVPRLITPLDGQSSSSRNLTLQWTDVQGEGNRFDLQVATRSDFASISMVLQTNLPEVPAAVCTDTDSPRPRLKCTTTFSADGDYYWRVRAVGGDWSTVRRFQLVSNAPKLVSPVLAPNQTSILTNSNVDFKWIPVDGASEYQFQIDTSPNFAGLLYLDDIFLNKIFLNKIFLNKIFLNKLTDDPIFLNKLLGDDIFLNKLLDDPIFLNKIFLNKLYADKIFLNKIFLNKIEDGGIFLNKYTLGKPVSEGVHYWRVRALLPSGDWSSWSDAGRFIVDTPRTNVVINEVQMRDPSWVELYNIGQEPVDLSNWQFLTYMQNGAVAFAYNFPPAFTIKPGTYVVLHEANGINTATDLYLGANTINWPTADVASLSTSNGAVASSTDLNSDTSQKSAALSADTAVQSQSSAVAATSTVVPTTVPAFPLPQATNTDSAVSAQSTISTGDDVVTAQSTFAINIGDTVSNGVPDVGAGNIETAAGNDVYTFTAAAGQVVYFDALSGINMTWRLTNPSSTQVFNTGITSDGGRQVLVAGTYTLTVTASAGVTGTYSFIIRTVTDDNFAINIGDTVSNGVPGVGAGNLESMGNQDTYTFSGTAGQILYFDSLSSTMGGNAGWQLFTPSNVSMFNASSSGDGGRQVLPATGIYTIRFYGVTTTTGTYSFKIWAVTDNSFPIVIGDTISNGVPGVGAGNIESPGNQDTYTFTATAGQVLYFDSLSSTMGGNAGWQLFNPSNSAMFNSSSSSDGGRQVLPATGTYKIVFYGNGTTTGTYSFTILTVSDNSFPIAIGDTISNGVPGAGAGNIESPGNYDTYTFSGTAGQILYFDSLSSTMGGNGGWQLTNPSNGVIFTSSSSSDGGRQVLPATGTYKIVFYGNGTTTGTYSFTILTVSDNSFPIAIGDTISNGVPGAGAGNLESPGNYDTYTFSGTAGQILYFDSLSSSMGGNGGWQLTNPSNGVIFTSSSSSDGGRQVLPATGTYKIVFYGNGTTTGTYSFTILTVTDNSFPIAIGDTISNGVPGAGAGNIESPGNYDTYTFSGTAGQILYFDSLSSTMGGNGGWQLTNPSNGVIFTSSSSSDGGRQVLPATGTYKIVFYGNGTTTGTYSFTILTVSDNSFPIAIGDTISNGVPGAGAGNLESPGNYDTYTFSGTAGQTLYFDSLSSTMGGNGGWQLINPSNGVIFTSSSSSDGGLRVLPATGTYKILFYGNGATTGTYSFKIWAATNQTFPISIGNTVAKDIPSVGAGNIETPNTFDTYTFSATAGQVVNIDSISTANNNITWQLLDPSSALIVSVVMPSDIGVRTLASTGTYTIRVSDGGSQTGTYSFRVVLSTNTEFPVNIGDTVSNSVPSSGAGNITPAGNIDVYTLPAVAGQKVSFDALTNNVTGGGSVLVWNLVDHTGAAVVGFTTQVFNDVNNVTLPATDTYKIQVQTDLGTGTGTYSFKVVNASAPQTFPISIGTTVSNGVPSAGAGNIETAAGTDTYTFSATAGQIVYFSALSGSGMTWRLVDPSSAQIFNTSISNDAGRLVLASTGTYTLTVTANSGISGTYSFSINAVTDNTFPIAIGDTVSNGVPGVGAGNIENPGNQDHYTFTATAGQILYFQSLGSNNSSLQWELRSPTNTGLFGTATGNDGGRVVIQSTGTYTINVYDYFGGPTTGTYSFKIWTANDDTFPIAIGDTVSNGVPGVGAGNIESKGNQDHYTFTATAGQILYFQSLGSNNSSLQWELRSPTNTGLFGTATGNDGGRVVIQSTGTYTINVYDYFGGPTTGTYSFKIWTANDDTFPIAIGDTVSNGVPGVGAGNIESKGNQDHYTFTATAGQILYFQSLGSNNSSLQWELRSPTNTGLFGTATGNDGGQVVIPTTGTYTINVYDYFGGPATGTYSFRVVLASSTEFPISLDQTVSDGVPASGAGNISPAGDVDVFSFTATSGQQITFDSLGGSATDLKWLLSNPSGGTVFDTSFTDQQGVTMPATGTYRLAVQAAAGNPTFTGTYVFQLTNAAANTFTSCAGVTGISSSECDALVTLYNNTNGASWTDNTNWLTTNTPCDWYGVTCGTGTVTSLVLNNNNLSGTIPTQLADLSSLQQLSLSDNPLTGSIPSSLGSLSNLQKLYLTGDQLSGSIPPELGNLANVQELWLYANQLTGSIPTELGNLSQLTSLDLSNNQLTGSIPTQLGSLTQLTSLILFSNQLTGSIPTQLSNLTALQVLDLHTNQLSGSIPSSLGSVTNLIGLNVYDNQLTGSIPTELGNLINLTELNLSINQLSGSIPSSLGGLTNLQNMFLNSNQLSGSIPPSLGSLNKVKYFYLYSNQLTGTIPPEVGNLSAVLDIFLNNNQLSGNIPTQLGNLSTLQQLTLNNNQLSGTIPSSLGSLSNLITLNLDKNQLSGNIPSQLANLTGLVTLSVDYNKLSSIDSALTTFLNTKNNGWANSQTVAPTNFAIQNNLGTSVNLTWTQIGYTGNTGGYDIGVSTTAGGPYTVALTTTSKGDSNASVTGLTAGTTYYFAIRSFTAPHDTQQNNLVSDWSSEIARIGSDTAQPGPTLTVNTTAMNDDGVCGTANCSLIEAINAANLQAGANTIQLGTNQTYTLTTLYANPRDGLPAVTTEIQLEGNGSTIVRSSTAGTADFHIMRLSGTAKLTLNNVTLSNGSDSAIQTVANTTLVITNSTISSNKAPSGGGAIFGGANITILNSTLSNNTTTSGGGAIIMTSGTLSVDNTTFSGNSASSSGGAIYSSVSITVTNSNFNNNASSTGGAIFMPSGTLVIDNTTLSGNSGGAIYGGSTATLTIRNGSSLTSNTAVSGSAITSNHILTISDSTISNNTATGVSSFGAVEHHLGTATITNSTFSGNTTTNNNGGAISNGDGAAMTITNSTLDHNSARSGAAIYNVNSSLIVTGGSINTNTATTSGGGIYTNGGTVTINGAALSANSATLTGGGLYNTRAIVTIINTTIASNTAGDGGGGIRNQDSPASMIIRGSTLFGNIGVVRGGGIFNSALLTITNSTLSGNNSPGGGAILNNGTLNVSSSTFASNGSESNGVNIVTADSGTSQVKNSILSASGLTNCATGPSATFTGVAGFATDASCNNIPSVTPAQLNLGTLANNGGTTQTIALGTGSVAINAVTDCTDTSNVTITADQRGIARPFGASCDVGAFEVNTVVPTATPAPTITPTFTPSPTPTNTATPPPSDTAQAGPTFNVNTLLMNDDGICGTANCSLIEAIIASNNNADANTIQLGLNQTYTLTDKYLGSNGGLPDIVSQIQINGNGSTIQRSTAAGTPDFYIFGLTSAKLALNNMTLSGASTGAIQAGANSTLIIANTTFRDNSSTGAGGAISLSQSSLILTNSVLINNSAPLGTGGALYLSNNSTAVIDNTVFSANSAAGAGAIYANVGSSIIIRNGTNITDNTSVQGSAIMNNGPDSTLTISNSTISNNIATGVSASGAVDNRLGTVTISNSTLSGNTAAGLGGALYNAVNGVMNLTGVTLDHNTASYGGAIYNTANSQLTITGGTINTNTAEQSGGGIYNEGVLRITDGTLATNTALTGGGISNLNGSTATITNTNFTGNTVGGNGAGLVLDGGSVTTITGGTFSGNSASGNGGAIGGTGQLTISDTTINNNQATLGGGINHGSAGLGDPMTVSNVTFQSNTANQGGGLMIRGGTVTVSGSTFKSNTATTYGGGIYNEGSLNLTNSTLSTNTADQGGGIYTNSSSAILTFNTISSNSGTTNGGGVYNAQSMNLSGGRIEFNNTNGMGAGVLNFGDAANATIENVNIGANTNLNGAGGGIANTGTLTVSKSAVTFNNAVATTTGLGGGIANAGKLTLTNSTVAYNQAYSGGAIENSSATPATNSLTVINSTISQNSAVFIGGINIITGTGTLQNSIISLNGNANCGGTLTTSASLEYPGPGVCGALIADPLLGTITADHVYFPLLGGSPALDAADNSVCPTTDQRSLPRGFNSTGAVNSPVTGDCDIGAVELFEVSSIELPPQLGTVGGGVALVNVLNGMDFVQFGDTNIPAPQGTDWQDGTPPLPAVGQTLGRDPASSDTDDRLDWLAQSPTLGGQNGVKVIINEVFPGSIDAVELFNPTVETVRMQNWQLVTYNANGVAEVTYTFPSTFTLAPGAYVVLREGSGTDNKDNLYLRASISWADSNGRGAVLLTNGNGGIDFMRFGDSGSVIAQSEEGSVDAQAAIVQPLTGTFWTGISPNAPLPNQSIARDSEAKDTDDGKDWFAQPPSLGSVNPFVSPAVNDDPNNAITMLRFPFRNTQSTDATQRELISSTQVPEPVPTCGFSVGHTVWYQFTAATSGTIRFQTDGSDFDTVMAVWTNINQQPVLVGCDDNSGEGARSRLDLNVEAGTTYSIQIGGANYANGNLVFSAQPPLNDDFDNAIVIGALPFTDTQNTLAASAALDDPTASCGIGAGRSVWYSFTATSDSQIVFRTTGSNFDTTISMWTGTRGNLTEVACNDDQGSTPTSVLTFRTIPGTTYYVKVAGNQDGNGNLIFKANLISSVANDFFAAPTIIDQLPYTTQEDTLGATNELLDRATLATSTSCPSNLVTKTVWFQYTAVTDGTVVFQTAGSDYDTVLAIWTDINQPSIACNDDAGLSTAASISLAVRAGTTYTILVGGWNNAGGNLVLNAFVPGPAPANDNLVNAFNASPLPYTITEDTTGATVLAGDPDPSCGLSVGNTVWFQISVPAAATLRFQTTGSSYDTVLAVYTRVNGTLVEIACDDDTGLEKQSDLTVNAPANTQLFIQVGGFGGAGGILKFAAAPVVNRPANDIFDNATVINSLPFSTPQSTLNATRATDDPLPSCGASVDNTVWYQFTATSNTALHLQTTNADFDVNLSLWTGARGSLTEVGCSGKDSDGINARLDFTPITGTTYYVMLSGNGGASGTANFEMQTFAPPANDENAQAEVITLDSNQLYSRQQDTRGATAVNDPATACNATTGATVWYSFTATSTGTLSLNTAGSNYNTILAVWATDFSQPAIACNDDILGASTSAVRFTVTQGTTYRIMVGGTFGETGTLKLNAALLSAPANDDFANAQAITLDSSSQYNNTQSINGATRATDDPTSCNVVPSRTVWYSFRATNTNLLNIRLDGTTYNTILAVYTGARGSLTNVLCNTFGSVDLTPELDKTYFIMVGSLNDTDGTLKIQASQAAPVANDDFNNAIEITSLPYSNTQDTTNASTSIDDPLTCTPSVGKSVWYKFTASTTATLELTLNGTNYNSVLSVYTGARGLLTQVTCSLFTGADVPVTAGTTYFISVSGFQNSAGILKLQASLPGSISITQSANPTTVTVPGGDVTFTTRVSNTSPIDVITLVSLSNDVYGNLNGKGTCVTPQTIAVGSFYECSFVGAVSGTSGAVRTNISTASANDEANKLINASASTAVTISDSVLLASGDTYSTDEDTVLNVAAPGVLANDTHASTTTLSAVLVTNATNGSVTLAADGSFTYTPNSNFNGSDSFTYKANDGTTDSNTVTVSITVNPVNDAPVVVIQSPVAGTVTAGTNGKASVVLNSSGTSDVEDTVSQLSFLWSWTENGNPVTVNAAGTVYDFPVGTYTITLTVTDSGNLSSTKTVAITVVAAPNQPPTANAGPDQTVTDADNNGSELVTLNGAGSSDSDGTIATYLWTENGVQIATGVSPQVTLAVGVHTLTLVVTDNLNAQGIDTVVITVNAGSNMPPTANAGADQTVTDVDNNGSEPVTLNGTGSSDSDGSIVSYVWQENGATLATTVSPTVTLAVGNHLLTLTVTDNRGASSSDTVSITVVSPAASMVSITSQVNASSDDVNQDGQGLNRTDASLWIGTGVNRSSSFTGLRFNALSIPRGSVINAARLEVYTPDGAWITVNVSIAAEAADSSATFTTATRPSTRALTTAKVTSNTTSQWLPRTWNSYDGLASLVQEVINRPGWQSGNSLSLILKGLGTAYARKFATSFDGNPAFAPRLIVDFTAPVVIAPNMPPVANAGPDQTLTDADNDGLVPVTLNGSASSDPDGSIVSYLWQENGTLIASGVTPVVTLPVGTHQLTLTVTDNRNAQSADTVLINIVTPPPPTGTVSTQVTGSGDDVNEDGSSYSTNDGKVWVGRGSSTASFAGLRFSNINVPQGATITSARLEVYSTDTSWISVTLNIAADAADNSAAFSNANRPSSRTRTAAQLNSSTDVQWLANTWYNYTGLAPMVQEIISRSGWQTGNSLSLILKGSGGQFGRKFIASFDGNPAFAPRLVITYTVPVPVVQPAVAAFISDVVTGTAPLTVQFSNQSTGTAPTYSWNFGDGATSTEANPSHVFNGAGTYTVSLTASNGAGSTTAQTVITVNAPIQPAVAAFITDVVTGTAPLTVQFSNQSTGTAPTYSWNFGDGTSSTEANPSHVFGAVGSYTVILTASNGAGSTTAQTVITVNPPAPVAAFSADVLSGTAPLTVSFSNQSTGEGISYSWNFGDGATSTEVNPVHTFNGAGTYTVMLTVSNAGGTSTNQITIQVSDPPAPPPPVPEATAAP